jgi:integrase
MATKPLKPSADFPLFPHASGKWAKKIRGKIRYFGRWDDPDGALKDYQRFADNSGKLPHSGGGATTLQHACNAFLTAKNERLKSGELSQSSFSDYKRTCIWLADHFGRGTPIESFTPQMFAAYKTKLAERRTVGSMGNEITRVRVFFKWCAENNFLRSAVKFGTEFRRPSSLSMRRHRQEQGKKLFTAEQIRLIMNESGQNFRAMILLGINCGFGNRDCATLPLGAVDLERGWISYPRPKTLVERELPLWPETVEALNVSLANRPEPQPGCEHLFFLRYSGKSWDTTDNWIAKRFRATLLWSSISVGGFYWLRHTFATVAGGAKDQIAVNAIMGHVDPSMAAVYREVIEPERLQAVTAHVRRWLFNSHGK